MSVQEQNLQMADLLSAYFPKRREPSFAWGNVISMFQMLPGLRGFWPMSSVDSTPAVFDLSGQGRTLSRTNVTFQWIGLAPTGRWDVATTRYLYRASEAGLSISGIEGHVSVGYQGLTMGGWFNFDALGSLETVMSKWNGTGNQRSYFLQKLAADTIQFGVSLDGGAVNVSSITTTVATTASAWIFLAGRFRPATDVAVWINGNQATNAAAIVASIFASTTQFEIGRLGNAANYFTGYGSLCFLCAAALPDYMINLLFELSAPLFGVTP